jgi:hypothetical protein
VCYDFSIHDKLENHVTAKTRVWLAFLLLATLLTLCAFFVIPLVASSLAAQRLTRLILQVMLAIASAVIAVILLGPNYGSDSFFFAFFFSGWQSIGVAYWVVFLSFVSGVYYFFLQNKYEYPA